MSVTLGSGYRPGRPDEPSAPDPTDLRLELILEALQSLRDGLNMLPAPQVTIDAPDLSAVVNAVNGLRPGVVDPDEIGRAVANALVPMRPEAADPVWQDKLIAALDKLDFRMKGLGSGGGGGPASLPPTLSSAPAADTGQTALPVRVISQLGAGSGGGGGTASSVTINDPTTTANKLAVDANGRVTVNQAGTVTVGGTVSVSNFPATQPVSIASTVPVSGTFWQATQPVSLATNTPDVTDRAARLLGHVTVDNASIPVTGTFFQATQPVSLATAPTTPVTGTFWQTTQPVSLATNTPDVIDRAARLLGVATLGAGSATIGTSLGPALTKGTQGTTGYAVQDLKDSGRTSLVLAQNVTTALAGVVATETALAFQQNKSGTATTGLTTYTVTSGKTLRLQSISMSAVMKGTTPAATGIFVTLRQGSATTSPILWNHAFYLPATANAVDRVNVDLPDGIEIPAAGVISLSYNQTVLSMAAVLFTIVGFEY